PRRRGAAQRARGARRPPGDRDRGGDRRRRIPDDAGGVAAAALVAAAQIVRGEGIEVRLYANLSDDKDGALVRRLLSRTPLSTARLGTCRGRYPKTHILNERGDGGVAERSFIAEAGVSDALALAPEDLDRDF